MPVQWIEGVARRIAIGAGATMALVVVMAGMLQLGRAVDLPPRLIRSAGRFLQPADLVLLVAAITFLASVLVAQQVRSGTWRSPRAFALFVIGGALVVAGVTNILLPMAVYPAGQLCISVWDVVTCEIQPWVGAPVAVLLGAAAMQIGANLNRAAGRITA